MWSRYVVALLFCGVMSSAGAQTRGIEEERDLINWYYAATYGTGIYSAGDRTVGVLQAPLSFTLRERQEHNWGLRLTVPISFGFYDFSFDDVVSEGLPSRISTMSVVPGIEASRMFFDRWLIRPYVSLGGGWELGGEESAWIYDVGVRSRLRIDESDGTVLSLVNLLSAAGYDPRGGSHQPLSVFAAGFDVEIPTGGSLFGRPITVSVLPVYYYYFRRLDFAAINDRNNKVREEAELAISLLAEQPFTVLGMDVDRIGIAIRGTSDVAGFNVFTTLPF